MTRNILNRRYLDHKNTAKGRDIQFLLSFEQWLEIWTRSKHLSKRGRGPGKYVMARKGDRGPYAIGNVQIILWERNMAERKMPCGEYNARSKLTVWDVLKIRAEFIPRSRTNGIVALAKKYNTPFQNIYLILKRKTWTHI